MKTKRWKGSFSIRRMSSGHDEPIARSPDYEFEILPTGDASKDWRAADVELCRRWNDQGHPLEGEPGVKAHDASLRLYRTLGTRLNRGDGWFTREERVFRVGIDVQDVGVAND